MAEGTGDGFCRCLYEAGEKEQWMFFIFVHGGRCVHQSDAAALHVRSEKRQTVPSQDNDELLEKDIGTTEISRDSRRKAQTVCSSESSREWVWVSA